MAYKVIILYRLYMPSYFLGTFTEYPFLLFNNLSDYPPKLSYMIEELSTPRLSSMLTTAFDIGPGPHM